MGGKDFRISAIPKQCFYLVNQRRTIIVWIESNTFAKMMPDYSKPVSWSIMDDLISGKL
jgi:hypothetical protein